MLIVKIRRNAHTIWMVYGCFAAVAVWVCSLVICERQTWFSSCLYPESHRLLISPTHPHIRVQIHTEQTFTIMTQFTLLVKQYSCEKFRNIKCI